MDPSTTPLQSCSVQPKESAVCNQQNSLASPFPIRRFNQNRAVGGGKCGKLAAPALQSQWRREERAREGATAVAIGPYTPQTARAVHRPKNNSNGATAKPRAAHSASSAVSDPSKHGEEGWDVGGRAPNGEGGRSRLSSRLDSATGMCRVLSARVLCRKG